MSSFDVLLNEARAKFDMTPFEKCKEYIDTEVGAYFGGTDAFRVLKIAPGSAYDTCCVIFGEFPDTTDFKNLHSCELIVQLLLANFSVGSGKMLEISYFEDAILCRFLLLKESQICHAMYCYLVAGGKQYESLINKVDKRFQFKSLEQFNPLLKKEFKEVQNDYYLTKLCDVDSHRSSVLELIYLKE